MLSAQCSVLSGTIAKHEAGHAVMAWLRGLPATELEASVMGGHAGRTPKYADREGDPLLLTPSLGAAGA